MDVIALKKARCAAGYFTQAAIAEALDMKTANYRNRENGLVKFSAEEMIRLCDKLGLSLEEGIKIIL